MSKWEGELLKNDKEIIISTSPSQFQILRKRNIGCVSSCDLKEKNISNQIAVVFYQLPTFISVHLEIKKYNITYLMHKRATFKTHDHLCRTFTI